VVAGCGIAARSASVSRCQARVGSLRATAVVAIFLPRRRAMAWAGPRPWSGDREHAGSLGLAGQALGAGSFALGAGSLQQFGSQALTGLRAEPA
jgi:hypothetical protein